MCEDSTYFCNLLKLCFSVTQSEARTFTVNELSSYGGYQYQFTICKCNVLTLSSMVA